MQFRKPAPGVPSPPPHKTHWPRFVLRFSGRLVLLLVIALVTILTFILFFPWSFGFIDSRIQQKWLEVTGIPLTYVRSEFRILPGQMEFKEVMLRDPKTGQAVARSPRVSVSMPLSQFFTSQPPYKVHEIRIDGPLELEVGQQDGRLTFGAWQPLIDMIRERQRPAEPRRAPYLTLGTINLAPVTFRWMGNVGGTPGPLAQAVDASIECRFNNTVLPQEIRLRGERPVDHDRAPVEAQVVMDWEQDSATVRAALERFRSALEVPMDIAWQLNLGRADLDMTLTGLRQADINLSGTLHGRHINFGIAPTLYDSAAADFKWKGLYHRAERRLQLDGLDVTMPSGSLAARGQFGLAPPFAYQLDQCNLRLKGTMLLLAARQFLGREGRLISDRADLALEGRAQGNLRAEAPENLKAHVAMSGVHWIDSRTGTVLRQLKVDADLDTHTVALHQARGLVNGIPLVIDGKLDGRPLKGEVDKLKVNWSTGGEIAELREALAQNSYEGLHVNGEFRGRGSIAVEGPIAGWKQTFEKAKLQGDLRFTNVEVRHPSIPRPVRHIKGHLHFADNRAVLEDFQGDVMNVDVRLTGTLTGKTQFWDRPDARLHPRLKFKAEELIDLADRLARQAGYMPPVIAGITGTGTLDLDLGFKDANWERPEYEGTLELADWATRLDLPLANGELKLRRALLSANPRHFEIREADGKFGELSIAATGSVNTSSGTLELSVGGPFVEAKRRMPTLLEKFKVGGDVRVTHHLQLVNRHAGPIEWMALWDGYRKGKPADQSWMQWISNQWGLEHEGVIHGEDAELTFYRMPSYLRHINGNAKYNEAKVWTPAMTPVDGGPGCKNLIGSIEYIYSNPVTQFLTFVVMGEHFAIDNWVRPWPRPAPVSEGIEAMQVRPYDPSQTPWFKVHGTAFTHTASYKGIQGTNFQGKIDFMAYHNQRPELRWYDIQADLYGGHTNQGGTWTSNGWKYWVIIDQPVNVRPLFKDWTGKDAVQGIVSGNVAGKLVIHRAGGAEPGPLQAEGDLMVRNSQFVSNKIFGGLGNLLRLPIFNDIVFSDIHAVFKMVDKKFSIDKVTLKSALVDIEATGTYVRQGEMDLTVQLQFISSLDRIPLIGNLFETMNKVLGKIFRVKVRGTPDNPNFSLI